MTQAYPLHWPVGYRRTKDRISSRFSVTLSQAIKNVMEELRRFGNDTGKKVESIVISSNVTLTDSKPADPGVALYFRWDNIDCAIAVDRYPSPVDNLQAIFKVVEAERTKMRHGGLEIVRAAFRGFAALPPPTGAEGQLPPPSWRETLFGKNDVNVDRAAVESRYRALVKEAHPDKGGDPAKFALIVNAVQDARQELR